MVEMIVKDKSKANGIGAKAESLRLLSDLGIPVPRTYLIDSEDILGAISDEKIEQIIEFFGNQNLIAIRPSSTIFFNELPTFLYLGISENPKNFYIKITGELNYFKSYCSLIKKISVDIFDSDPDIFDDLYYKIIATIDKKKSSHQELVHFKELLAKYKIVFKDMTGEIFPQT